ncbi:hypothetical protein [Citricoccus sp. GCM10030269]|uniref:hypothetical protein n=1 Tax=Citricoccus sp. GCM10030269 TaxID=3273388 RepID=UPI00361AD8FC
MNDQQILWLVIGVVVLLIIIAVAVVLGNRRRARRREEDHRAAEQLREDAARQYGRTRAEEEEAAAARQEAEAAEEEARRLRAEAEERERAAGTSRGALDSQLREADRLDPEVQTDRKGHRQDGADPVDEIDPHNTSGRAGGSAGTGVGIDEERADSPPRAQESSVHARHKRDESEAEHEIVERRIALDPSEEPRDSVAAGPPLRSGQEELPEEESTEGQRSPASPSEKPSASGKPAPPASGRGSHAATPTDGDPGRG